MVRKWEKELLLLENIKKRHTFDVDVVVATPITFAIKNAPHVGLEEVERLQDIIGKIKILTKFA